MDETNSPDASERRRSTRAPVARPVLFAGSVGSGMLRSGRAMDISAGGILIHTPQPELVGRHLELELHPEEGVETGEVIMVKGEVARVEPLSGTREYAMGVRFLTHAPATDATGPRLRPATASESRDLAGAIQRQLDAMVPAVRLEVSGAARKAAAKKAPGRSPAPPTRSRRRWRPLLLTLLLLILLPAALVTLLYGVIAGMDGLPWGVKRPVPMEPATVDGTEEGPVDPALPDPIDKRLADIEADGPAYYINRGSYFLVQGKHPAAEQAFKRARTLPEMTELQQFVAQLGEAQALAGRGETDGAIAVLEEPFTAVDYVPEPWLALKAAFLEGLYNNPESPVSRAPLVNAVTFSPTAPTDIPDGVGGPDEDDEAGTPSPDGGGAGTLKLEVDTTRHLLTVLENNAIKAVYPVGLGFDGRTPEGLYSITNKIKNPDWYNRGQIVPAGDPDNEIVSRWMGLSDDSGPTPLGIHGTNDGASIGENLSRGCIRMRPADVEALYTMVSAGTPVHIRAL